MFRNRTTITTVLVCAALGVVAAGCGGSDSATSSSVATEAQAAVSSAAQAATSAASSAQAGASSVAEDAKQRISSALPALDGLVDSVAVDDANGSATVTTKLSPTDTAAEAVKSACGSLKQAMGDGTTSLTILGTGGATIATC
jgi:hypothetical protein